MPKLYEIDQQILDCVDEETGEILDFERLTQLQIVREKKLEGVALFVKNLTTDAAAYKAEKEYFVEREKKAANKIEKLKEWLAIALGGQKLTTERVIVGFRKSEAVEVYDPEVLPAGYIVRKVTETPDKAKIKEDLKNHSDLEIPGCKLILKNNIQIK